MATRSCSSRCVFALRRLLGGARASITSSKRRRLKFAAGLFLSGLKREPACRFDAILLDGLDRERIEWLVNIDVE